jgi:TRAP-type C4-dicarboxylate transport system permease small subunit
MTSMNGFWPALSRRISLFARWFSAAGLVLMTLIMAWQVFARYVLNASPAWAEQAALLLMIWFVMFAAAAGVREGFHIRIGVLADNLEGRAGMLMRLLAHGVVGLFGIAMAVWGAEIVQETWRHVIPTLGISRGFAYLPIAINGVLIFGFALEQGIAELRGRAVDKLWS